MSNVRPLMLKRTADFASTLETIGFLATIVLGVGCLGFVAVTWAQHMFASGRLALGGVVCAGSVALAAAAVARIPVALVILLGSAVVVGTAFLLDAGSIIMP